MEHTAKKVQAMKYNSGGSKHPPTNTEMHDSNKGVIEIEISYEPLSWLYDENHDEF